MLNKIAAIFAGVVATTTFTAPAFADIAVSGNTVDLTTLQVCTGSNGVVDNDFYIDLGDQNGSPIALSNGDTLTLNIPFTWDLSDEVAQECFDAALALNGIFPVAIDDADLLALDGVNGLSLVTQPGPTVIDAITGNVTLTYVYDVSGLVNEILYLDNVVEIEASAGFTFITDDIIIDGSL